MSTDTNAPPILPTVDKLRRHLAAVPDMPEVSVTLEHTDGTVSHPVMQTGHLPDLPPLPWPARCSTIQYPEEVHRLADVARALPKVVTVHERYGQPPGDLAYTPVADWTADQQARGAAWLANQRSAEWWALQGAAQRQAVAR